MPHYKLSNGHVIVADETFIEAMHPDAILVDSPDPVAPPRHVTQFAFRTRVGDDLVATMELAAMHNPADAPAVQLAKAKQRAAMARCFSAQYLDLDSAELRAGFAGVPAADFARIFDAEVLDSERP